MESGRGRDAEEKLSSPERWSYCELIEHDTSDVNKVNLFGLGHPTVRFIELGLAEIPHASNPAVHFNFCQREVPRASWESPRFRGPVSIRCACPSQASRSSGSHYVERRI